MGQWPHVDEGYSNPNIYYLKASRFQIPHSGDLSVFNILFFPLLKSMMHLQVSWCCAYLFFSRYECLWIKSCQRGCNAIKNILLYTKVLVWIIDLTFYSQIFINLAVGWLQTCASRTFGYSSRVGVLTEYTGISGEIWYVGISL